MHTQNNTITAAYKTMLTEEVTPKFPSGTKVGIGYHSHDGIYNAIDTGTVTDVDKQGNHTVTHDTQKHHEYSGSLKDSEKSVKTMFNSMGIGKSNRSHISTIADHNTAIAHAKKSLERTQDLSMIINHLQAARTQNGVFSAPLQKTQVEHLKSLLDKHCA